MRLQCTKCNGARDFVLLPVFGILTLLYGQANGTPTLSASQAKEHVGELAIVCGKVVGARISKWAIAQHGKPITFYMDQPEADPVFFFVAWSPDPSNPEQTKGAYEGKQVCVTGKIMNMNGVPHILATEASQIQVQSEKK